MDLELSEAQRTLQRDVRAAFDALMTPALATELRTSDGG
jgi:hypothetical protein